MQKNSSSGTIFEQLSSTDFSANYFTAFFEKLSALRLGVFLRLCGQSSIFFDQKISDSIECLQKGVLSNFLDFAEQNGSLSTKISSFDAFVKSKNPFFIAKNFSRAFGLPVPEISF